MQATRNAVATDPRNKIHGVLGFFGDRGVDPHNIFPAPDYTRTAAELYAEVTRALVTTKGSCILSPHVVLRGRALRCLILKLPPIESLSTREPVRSPKPVRGSIMQWHRSPPAGMSMT